MLFTYYLIKERSVGDKFFFVQNSGLKTMKKNMNFTILAALICLLFTGCQQKSQHDKSGEKDQTQLDINKENKRIVLDFYQQMFGDKDLSAVDKYIAPEYIQHNPQVADGAAAFKAAAAKWFEGQPKTTIDVQHIASDGDLVFIHLRNKNPDGSLKSTIDIFR